MLITEVDPYFSSKPKKEIKAESINAEINIMPEIKIKKIKN